MTQERYLKMCEQMGKEPDLEEMPPNWDDFPDIVTYCFNTFSMLGDRMYPDIGYVGKDYTNLQAFLKAYQIEDIELFLEILNLLDSRAIERSQQVLKRERDKLKRKS